MSRRKPDVEIQDEGTIIVLYPRSKRAKAWFAENVDDSGLSWCGGIPVEHRFVGPILDGVSAVGMTF